MKLISLSFLETTENTRLSCLTFNGLEENRRGERHFIHWRYFAVSGGQSSRFHEYCFYSHGFQQVKGEASITHKVFTLKHEIFNKIVPSICWCVCLTSRLARKQNLLLLNTGQESSQTLWVFRIWDLSMKTNGTAIGVKKEFRYS